APPPLCPVAVSGRAAKSRPYLGKSRVRVEVSVPYLRKRVRVSLKLGFDPIYQGRESGARAAVADYFFPRCIAVQFWHQSRQVLGQLLPVIGRERTDGRLDFLNRAHVTKLLRNQNASKPAFGRVSKAFSGFTSNRKSKIPNS